MTARPLRTVRGLVLAVGILVSTTGCSLFSNFGVDEGARAVTADDPAAIAAAQAAAAAAEAPTGSADGGVEVLNTVLVDASGRGVTVNSSRELIDADGSVIGQIGSDGKVVSLTGETLVIYPDGSIRDTRGDAVGTVPNAASNYTPAPVVPPAADATPTPSGPLTESGTTVVDGETGLVESFRNSYGSFVEGRTDEEILGLIRGTCDAFGTSYEAGVAYIATNLSPGTVLSDSTAGLFAGQIRTRGCPVG